MSLILYAEGPAAHLADVDEATHEVLVAQGVDRRLCLISSRILNNSADVVSSELMTLDDVLIVTYPHPYTPGRCVLSVNHCSTKSNQGKPGSLATILANLAHSVRK